MFASFKSLAKLKMAAAKVCRFKRTEGALRQNAFTSGSPGIRGDDDTDAQAASHCPAKTLKLFAIQVVMHHYLHQGQD
jgi:hypothetical protein